jgi:hypothetical protein
MSDDEIRKQALKFLRGHSPCSTREVRAGVTARASRVDRALRALLSENRAVWTDTEWYALRSDGTRYGHETCKSKPSGRQVSYLKAVRVVERVLVECGHPRSEATQLLAERWMRDALPEKQRTRS